MRHRCEILNHGIHGYEVWLHGRSQARSGVNDDYNNCFKYNEYIYVILVTNFFLISPLFPELWLFQIL